MPWPQTTGATHHHTQLGLVDKGSAIKGLVVCDVVWLESMNWMCLRTCAVLIKWCLCVSQ